jgi:neutral ceramidase
VWLRSYLPDSTRRILVAIVTRSISPPIGFVTLMNRILSSITLCLLFVGWTFAAESTWQAGAASVQITPDEPIQMAGYGSRNHPAEATLADLSAKALVLDDGSGNRVVLLTLDLVGIHRDTATRICRRLSEDYSLRREQIAINCSHTHTGPAVGMNLAPLHYMLLPPAMQAKLDAYESELVEKLVSLVGDAVEQMQPCTVTHGIGMCSFAVNRRDNAAADVPRHRALGTLAGPYDHDVPVLAIRDASLELKAIVFGYACHATVLSSRQWSGDYPGFAQQEIERRYPGATALFWAGCGADQNPIPRREVELARQYGTRLGTSVAEVVEGTMRSVEPRIRTAFREIDLPLTELPSVEELRITADSPEQKYEQARAKYLLDRLSGRDQLADHYAYPVATWLLGNDVRFVFLGGEVVVDYALRIKGSAAGGQQGDQPSVWVAGYSNDVMAYIPSRRVLREGGYEGGGSNVYYGLPGLWSPDIEKMIIAEVDAQSSDDRAAN